MSKKVVCLPERLPLGCMSPWPICLGSCEAVFERSKSSETDTPSFTEKKKKKSLHCQQQQSFLQLSRFIYQISITVCAKPLLLQVNKTLRKPGSLRVLSNYVCLVTRASAACIVYREDMQTGNNDVSGMTHILCLYIKLYALWLQGTLYLVSWPATDKHLQMTINQLT